MISKESFPFVEWETPHLQNRLGEVAIQLRTIPYTEERGQQVGREAAHLLFELEQRGAVEPFPTPNDIPKRKKKR